MHEMVASTPSVWQGKGQPSRVLVAEVVLSLHPQPRDGVLVLRGSQARFPSGINGGKCCGSTCPILLALCRLRAGPCPEGLRKAKKEKEER